MTNFSHDALPGIFVFYKRNVLHSTVTLINF